MRTSSIYIALTLAMLVAHDAVVTLVWGASFTISAFVLSQSHAHHELVLAFGILIGARLRRR